MSLKDFQIVSKLGDGAYSTVYKVIRHEDQKIYALKRVKIFSLSIKQQQNALNEIRILASIRHPNIICYKEAFVDQQTKSLCIVIEFANYGDLAYRIAEKQKKGELFTEHEIWDFFIQIVKGLSELHSLNIFHRDIKSANIFLNDDHDQIIAKLGDMNVSKISEKGLCMTQTGTPYYASPEVWKDLPYDSKSDIWSLGCVLYEMITLKPPFRAEDMEGLFKKVTRGIYPRIPQQYSGELSSMVRMLLHVSAQSRPTCEKILKLPIILKKMKELEPNKKQEKLMLLRTIKPGENFIQLQQSLPKANYMPLAYKKDKVFKTAFGTIQEGLMMEIDSLPILQKDKKIKGSENSDRSCFKSKQVPNNIEKDRKRSEISHSNNKAPLDIQGISKNQSEHVNPREIKLPKVHLRNNKKQREILKKQKSLRNHKVYN